MSSSPPPDRNKRPYLRSVDRRRQLLEATGRLFDRVGFAGITMSGLAAEAGVSRQLVYDHFGDLDSLYLAFVESRLARYRATRPDVASLDAGDAAAAVFGHLLTIPPADRRIVRLLLADVGSHALERVRERFRSEELAHWSALTPMPGDARVAAALVGTATSALLALADAVTGGDIDSDPATDLAARIVRAVIPTSDGAGARPGAANGGTGRAGPA